MQSLLHYNTFGIDQACRRIYEPATVEALKALLPELRRAPLLVIGGGSNLLLTKDFDGNVLHPRIKGMELSNAAHDDDTVLMRCGAGEVWDDVIAFAVSEGLYNMENMSFIPGEVGASAIQNVGAYGMEAKDVIYKVEAVEIATGKEVVFDNEDCGYAYRYSKFKAEWKGRYVITYVTYRLSRRFTPHLDYGNLRAVLALKGVTEPTAQDVRQAVIEIRQAKLPDPKVEGNAGSFFMNPVVDKAKFDELYARFPEMPYYVVGDGYKIPAGWMIEQCGWKGRTLGKAGVHSRQALVLVNKGGAAGKDIVALCDAVRGDVYRKFGIDIHPEVNIV
uniref:UDP-N-acetylenolpyruvoylglucosamine reductase n=1 Tax=uncultured Prevotella sp. TaxID=159272 RepID=A0A6G8F1J3_9BACT|nr:UDP-N-acetylenolpyruvoylglucosamine reductase [uncultured Prevotella sp.]